MGKKVVVKNRRARRLLLTVFALATVSTLLGCSGEREVVAHRESVVELSDIVDGTGGFVIGDIRKSSQYQYPSACVVSGAGDVNGDGLDDLIVGIPENGSDSSEYYVVFGKTDGMAVEVSNINDGTRKGFIINGTGELHQIGTIVTGAGDVNGDGLDDLLIGSPGGRDSYVVFGKASSTAVELSSIGTPGNSRGFVINGYGYYSINPSGAGDVNGDGLDDLIFGLPRMDVNGSPHAGKSYVVFGKASYTAVELTEIAMGNGGFVINGIEVVNPQYVIEVSDAGDVNGDGLADLIVFTGSHSGKYLSTSMRVYVVFGKASGTAVELSDIAGGRGGFVIGGIEYYVPRYVSVAPAGDVNGDGLDDLIVRVKAQPVGRCYVVFGKASEMAVNLSLIPMGVGGFMILGAGVSVSAAGDVNGDGLDDIVVGARNELHIKNDGDGNYVVFGKKSGTVVESSSVAASNGGFRINGTGELYGISTIVSGAGDVNGDGLDDLIISDSPWKTFVVFSPMGKSKPVDGNK